MESQEQQLFSTFVVADCTQDGAPVRKQSVRPGHGAPGRFQDLASPSRQRRWWRRVPTASQPAPAGSWLQREARSHRYAGESQRNSLTSHNDSARTYPSPGGLLWPERGQAALWLPSYHLKSICHFLRAVEEGWNLRVCLKMFFFSQEGEKVTQIDVSGIPLKYLIFRGSNNATHMVILRNIWWLLRLGALWPLYMEGFWQAIK